MTAHTIVLIWFFRVFFPSFLDLFSIYKVSTISAPTRSLPFLSFIVPIFGQNSPLISPIFLKRSLVFPLLLFFSFIHGSLIPGLSYLNVSYRPCSLISKLINLIRCKVTKRNTWLGGWYLGVLIGNHMRKSFVVIVFILEWTELKRLDRVWVLHGN